MQCRGRHAIVTLSALSLLQPAPGSSVFRPVVPWHLLRLHRHRRTWLSFMCSPALTGRRARIISYGMCIVFIGVFVNLTVRKALVIDYNLPYPTGTAVGTMIRSFFNDGRSARRQAAHARQDRPRRLRLVRAPRHPCCWLRCNLTALASTDQVA